MSRAALSQHGGLKPRLLQEADDLVVEGTRLQPHGGAAEVLGLAQDGEGGGGRSDDRERGLGGVWEAGDGGKGGEGRVDGGEGDGGGCGVDGRCRELVGVVPIEDWGGIVCKWQFGG